MSKVREVLSLEAPFGRTCQGFLRHEENRVLPLLQLSEQQKVEREDAYIPHTLELVNLGLVN